MAGIFVAHGFWVGKTFGGPGGVGSGGYINHENKYIKALIKRLWPLNAGVPCKVTGKERFTELVRNIVPSDTLWLFKGPAEYYPIFQHYFPAHVPVMVFRKTEQAVLAHVRRYGEKVRSEAKRIVDARYHYMNHIVETHKGAYKVSADDIVAGEYGAVKEVIEKQYNITFDVDLAESMIDVTRWHS